MQANIYIDTGIGFNEDEKLQQRFRISRNNNFTLKFNLENFTNVRELRIDLCDDLYVLQNVIVCTSSNTDLNVISCGIQKGDKSYYINEPARVLIQNLNNSKIKDVEVSGVITQPTLSEVTALLNDVIQDVRKENIRLENAIAGKQIEIIKSCEMYTDKMITIDEMNKTIDEMNITIENLQKINELNVREINSKQQDLDALNNDNMIKQTELDIIHSSIYWKLTKPFRKFRKMR